MGQLNKTFTSHRVINRCIILLNPLTTLHLKQALEELYLLDKKKPKILRSRTILEQIPSESLIARTEFSRHTSFKPVSTNAAGVTEATSRNIDFAKTRLCRSAFLPSTTILTSPFATSSICCRKFCTRSLC